MSDSGKYCNRRDAGRQPSTRGEAPGAVAAKETVSFFSDQELVDGTDPAAPEARIKARLGVLPGGKVLTPLFRIHPKEG